MSADKRKQILIVFAGLAVVLVGVIAYVSPNFRSEDVSGAIGAVQKHREPQIKPQDVVLGDEKVKQEEQILYAEFLNDAATLRNLSVDAAVAARSAEANVKLADVEQSLAAREIELNRRFVAGMTASVVEAKQLANEDQLAALGRKKLDAIVAEADALGRAVRNEEQLASADMEQLSSRLAAISTELAIAPCCSRGGLVNSENQLARMIRNADEQGATAAFAKSVDSLEARSTAARVRNHAEYLAAIAKQAKAVANAEAMLNDEENLAARKGIIAILIGAADQLESRAFANMKAQMASEAVLAAHLARLTSMVASMEDVALSRKKLQAAEMELQAKAAARPQFQLALFDSHLQAHEALNTRLSNDPELSRRLQNEDVLVAMRDHLRSLSTVEGRSLQASALEQRAINLQSRKR